MRRKIFAFCIISLLMVSCYNPFFPPMGSLPRIPPSAIVDDLITAYENRRIDLFEALFLTDEYRFYVSPEFEQEYSGKLYSNPVERIDSVYQYVYVRTTKRDWFYWTYAWERQSHENLFSRAISINFDQRIQVMSNDVTYLKSSAGDTVLCEIVTTGGKMTIVARTTSGDVLQHYPVEFERQVFYLKKNSLQEWKIVKWFDLSGVSGGI